MIVLHAPRTSALYRATHEDAEWGLTEHLLAGVFDVLRILVWQSTEDGHTGRNAPVPLDRPGIEPATTTIRGSGAMTVEEADAWLAARNPAQHQG